MAKRPSKRNTFGWVRMEVLGALTNAVFLIALCFSIIMEALTRLAKPERTCVRAGALHWAHRARADSCVVVLLLCLQPWSRPAWF